MEIDRLKLLIVLGDIRQELGFLQADLQFKHNRRKLINRIEELQASLNRGNFS